MTLKGATLLAILGSLASFTLWQIANWDYIHFDFSLAADKTNYRIYSCIAGGLEIGPLVLFLGVLYSKQQ